MPSPFEDARRKWIERLYDTYGGALFRYAAVVLADSAAAEDVVQEVFMKLVRTRVAVESERQYLWKATRNECFSVLRRQRTRKAGVADSEALLECRGIELDPADRLALEAAINKLPPEQREVVHLKAFQGLTFGEAAALLEENPDTVASRYRYAIARMRELLGNHGNRS